MVEFNPLNEPPPPDASPLIRRIRFWAAITSIIGAVIGIFGGKAPGEGALALVTGTLLLAASVPDGPGNTPKEILDQLGKQLSIRGLFVALVKLIRYGFQYGDSLVRFLLILIAFGGTAWVIKDAIGFNIIPDYVDVWIKRFGPALAIITIILYPVYLISKRLFILSTNNRGKDVHTYELMLYICTITLCVFILMLFYGKSLETVPGISTTARTAQAFEWTPDQLKMYNSIIAILSVWTICFAGCLVSKYFEWSWRDRQVKVVRRPRIVDAPVIEP